MVEQFVIVVRRATPISFSEVSNSDVCRGQAKKYKCVKCAGSVFTLISPDTCGPTFDSGRDAEKYLFIRKTASRMICGYFPSRSVGGLAGFI